MNTQEIKKLAQLIVEQNLVSGPVKKYLFENMRKSELKIFLTYLKNELRKIRVTAVSAVSLDQSTLLTLKKMYGVRTIENVVDPQLGSGLVIFYKDDIIDMSLKGFVRRLVQNVS